MPPRENSPPHKKRKKHTHGTHEHTMGQVTVKGIPNGSTLILKHHLSRLENEAAQLRRLKDVISKKHFCFGEEAQTYLASGLPQGVSGYTLEPLVPAVVASVLAQAQVPFDPERLTKSMPGYKTLNKLMETKKKEGAFVHNVTGIQRGKGIYEPAVRQRMVPGKVQTGPTNSSSDNQPPPSAPGDGIAATTCATPPAGLDPSLAKAVQNSLEHEAQHEAEALGAREI